MSNSLTYLGHILWHADMWVRSFTWNSQRRRLHKTI